MNDKYLDLIKDMELVTRTETLYRMPMTKGEFYKLESLGAITQDPSEIGGTHPSNARGYLVIGDQGNPYWVGEVEADCSHKPI